MRGPGRLRTTVREHPAWLCPAQAILKRALPSSCTVVPLMKKEHPDNLQFFLSNLGRVHLAG